MYRTSIYNKKCKCLSKENLIFIFIFILMNITTIFSYAPYSSDENGYLAQAAFLAGRDWSGVAQQLAYFSFGNGLFVFNLFKLGLPSRILYQVLLVINSLLLCSTYKICIYITKKVFQRIDDNKGIVIALIVTMHPRNFTSSNFYIAESYITFVFWLLLFFLVKYYYSRRAVWLFCFFILDVYIFFVHQRTILISLSGVVVMIWLLFSCIRDKEQRIRSFIWYGVIFIAALIVFVLLYKYKRYSKPLIWPVNLHGDGANDFASDPSVYLNNLKSMKFIKGLLLSIAGKIWYLLIGTLGFVMVGLSYLTKRLFNSVKNKDFFSTAIPFFLLCSFAGSLAIAAYWQVDPWRIDQIPYGRYMEVLLGPYIMFGLASFLVGFEKYNARYWVFIILILGKIVEIFAGVVLEKTSWNDLGATPVVRIFLTDPYKAGEYLKVTMLFAGIIILVDRLSSKRKDVVLVFLLGLYILSSTVTQYTRINSNIDNYRIVRDVRQMIDNEVIRVGYLSINLYANELQFLNPNWSFIRLKDYDAINDIDYVLLTAQQYENFLKNNSDNKRFDVKLQNEEIIILQIENE